MTRKKSLIIPLTFTFITTILKKNRQHHGQIKKDKRTNNDLQNLHRELKIE